MEKPGKVPPEKIPFWAISSGNFFYGKWEFPGETKPKIRLVELKWEIYFRKFKLYFAWFTFVWCDLIWLVLIWFHFFSLACVWFHCIPFHSIWFHCVQFDFVGLRLIPAVMNNGYFCYSNVFVYIFLYIKCLETGKRTHGLRLNARIYGFWRLFTFRLHWGFLDLQSVF